MNQDIFSGYKNTDHRLSVILLASLILLAGSWGRQMFFSSGISIKALQSFYYRIDINNTDQSELTLIPGIGPRLSEAIVRQHEERGCFRTVSDLLCVKGLGPEKTSEIAKWILRDEHGNLPVAKDRKTSQ
jgi:competence ComEA-like helix-hairpin-helix protein